MKKMILKSKNWIYVIVSIGILGLVLVALHDMQTALGVGLYISICAGAKDRMVYDMATDMVLLVALILLIGIPCLVKKDKKMEAFLRFLLVFLAFMPQLSPAYLVHFFNEKDLFQIRPAFSDGEVVLGFLE